MEEIVTTAELAEALRLTPQALRKRRMKGLPPAWVRVGRRAVRYRRQDVEVWLEEGRCRRMGGREEGSAA